MFSKLKTCLSGSEVHLPDSLTNEVTVKKGRTVKVTHSGQYEAGFEGVNLVFPERFAKVLSENGLNPENVVRIKGGNIGNYLYLWANDDVMLISETNPTTDEPDCDDMPDVKTGGFGHFVGIQGRKDTVRKLFNDLKREAKHVNKENPTRREFL